MDKNVRLSSSFCNSGYGFAGRSTFTLLKSSGLNVIPNIIKTPMSRLESSKDKILDEILAYNKKEKYDVNIAQLVPPLANLIFEKNKYNILFFFLGV